MLSESNERPFNWKVLLENYSENYHTPFVHPQIDTSSEDYPMVSDGGAVRLGSAAASVRVAVDQIRATLLPGEPGWDDWRRYRSVRTTSAAT